MKEIFKLLIGIGVLAIGYFIGILFAKFTKKYTPEEIEQGKPWFKLLIILSLIGAIIALIFRNDGVLFTCLFIAVATLKSLKV